MQSNRIDQPSSVISRNLFSKYNNNNNNNGLVSIGGVTNIAAHIKFPYELFGHKR